LRPPVAPALALAVALALAAPACGSRTGLLETEPLDAGGEAPAVPEAAAADEGAADAAPPLLDWGVGFDDVCMLEPGGGAGCFRFRPGAADYDVSLDPVAGVSGATHMAGHEGYCAILSDATVTCWRRTAPGPVPLDTPAQPVEGLDQVVQLDTCSYGLGGNACAVRSDGSVWCWGDDSYNELGRGNRCPGQDTCDSSRHAPGPVVKLGGAVEVAVSDVQACARTSSSDVVCWGRVGIPSDFAPDYSSPIPIPGSEGATALAVTEGLTVATLPGAFLYFGAPMTGEGPLARHPVQEPREPGERIFGSQYDTFCTKVPGARVHCKGGVGLDGTSLGGPLEYDVPGTEGAVDANVSSFTACARLSASDLVCWGTYTAGVSRIHVTP
jgi:hypothetical protein